MMTASEALAASKKRQVDIIENAINDAIAMGKYEVNFLNSLTKENEAMIVKAGYKVNEKTTMLGREISISWEEPKVAKAAKKITKQVKKK